MTAARKLVGAVLAVAVAAGVGTLSRLPTTYANEGDAQLRLSWRVEGITVEECRARTEEELQALAPHMRTPEVCSGQGASYELRVMVDGARVAQDTIVPAGARRDRPAYVFREFDIDPGTHSVEVAFRALVPASFESDRAPLEYLWAGDVVLEPMEIALLTLGPDGRSLVLRGT